MKYPPICGKGHGLHTWKSQAKALGICFSFSDPGTLISHLTSDLFNSDNQGTAAGAGAALTSLLAGHGDRTMVGRDRSGQWLVGASPPGDSVL